LALFQVKFLLTFLRKFTYLINSLALIIQIFEMTITDGVCFFQHVMKNAFSLQMILFLDAINFTRYVFIFWHKNPAIFLDAFWSFFINTWVICFSLLSQSVYAYLPGSIFIR